MTKGERIRQLREMRGLRQGEAAELIGVSKQLLYKYEKDIVTNIPSDVIERMASVYDTSPAYIFGWKEQEKTNPDVYLAKDKALLEMYHNVPPEVRSMVDYLLKSAQHDAEDQYLPGKNSK